MEILSIESLIESNIPIIKKSNKLQYGFDKMNVGDSIYFENPKLAISMSNYLRQFIHKNGLDMKFIVRKHGNGMRIWRTN